LDAARAKKNKGRGCKAGGGRQSRWRHKVEEGEKVSGAKNHAYNANGKDQTRGQEEKSEGSKNAENWKSNPGITSRKGAGGGKGGEIKAFRLTV